MLPRVLCCSGSLAGGGSERQLSMLVSRLDPQRFETEVYLLYRKGLYLAHLPEQIPVHSFWSAPEAEQKKQRFNWPGKIHRAQVQHLRQVIRHRKIDVVYDRTFHMTLVTAAACRRNRTPRISVIVAPPSQDFTRKTERFYWFKKRLLARAYCDPLCIVVALSNAVAEDALQFFPRLHPERIRIIPSAVDVAGVEQAAMRDSLWDSTNIADLKVIVVGRLSPEKDQGLVLQAVARLRLQRPALRVVLMLIGEGPDRAVLQRQAMELGISDCVFFMGFQDNPYPLILGADLLCLPSRYEGLPNVAMEALCLKTPVLATASSGSVRELLGDRERGVLIPPGDVNGMVTEMLDRIEKPTPWMQRTEAGYAWIREHHDLNAWLERMGRLLESGIKQGQITR